MNISVLILGQIRGIDIFLKSLEIYIQAKRDGIIQQIVFSTWFKEIDNYDGLRIQLASLGVELVETFEPIEFRTAGHYFHQMRGIYEGLSIIDINNFVFKTRTDVVISSLESLKSILCKDLTIKQPPWLKKDLSYKIWVSHFEITHPFFICDLFFFAHHSDIIRFLNFDNFPDQRKNFDPFYDSVRNSMHSLVEVRFYSNPFLQSFPILQEFRNIVHLFGYCTQLKYPILNYCLQQQFFWQILTVYYFILHSYFVVGGSELYGSLLWCKTNPIGDSLLPSGKTESDKFSDNFNYQKISKEGDFMCDSNEWLENVFNRKINEEFVLKDFHSILYAGLSYSKSSLDRERFLAFKRDLINRFYT